MPPGTEKKLTFSVLSPGNRPSLTPGRLTEEEIVQAAQKARGFVFSLTHASERSDWVRETERTDALRNRGLDGSLGIVPIFRGERVSVTQAMQSHACWAGKSPEAELAEYDLSPFQGYVMARRAGATSSSWRARDSVSGGAVTTRFDQFGIALLARRSPGAA